MPDRITRVAINGFRGATQPCSLAFDGSKPVVVVFGENGTGKSTVVDAIEFAANGTPGSLSGRRPSFIGRYLPSLGSQPGSLSVSLTVGGVECGGCLQRNQPSLTGDESARPRAQVLRRAGILGLVLAKPAEKYKALGRFVAVPGVEASEAKLRDAARSAAHQLENVLAAQTNAENNLNDLWERERRPGSSAVGWAEHLSQQDAQELKARADKLAAILTALGTAENRQTELDEAMAEQAATERKLEEGQTALDEAQSVSDGVEVALLDLLASAQEYIATHLESLHCPVCEQGVDPHELHERLEQRQIAGKQVRDARSAVTKAERAMETADAESTRTLTAFLDATNTTAQAAEASQITGSTDGVDAQAARSFLTAFEEGEAGDLQAVEPMGRAFVTTLTDGRSNIEAERDTARDDAAKLNGASVQLGALQTQQELAQTSSEISSRLARAREIVEDRRKQFIESQLVGITDRVCELYGGIHPGEDLGEIAFALDPNRQGSVNLTGKFATATDVPPEAYYSESHLDSLGICVFLALAEKTRVDDRPNILILDDVLTSADLPHIDRLMSTIHGVATGFAQVFITTHSRYWFESYRRSRGPVANVQLIELAQWTLNLGIRSDTSPLPTDELREALAETRLDRQAVASKAGVILEDVLDHLAHCYRLRLRTNRLNQYSLAELLDAIPTSFRPTIIAHLPAPAEPDTLAAAPILEAIQDLAPIRNWLGAHRNPLGDDVPEASVRELGQRALELTAVVTCPACGQRAGKKAGTHWTCHCRGMKLEPLAQDGQDPPEEDVIP